MSSGTAITITAFALVVCVGFWTYSRLYAVRQDLSIMIKSLKTLNILFVVYLALGVGLSTLLILSVKGRLPASILILSTI